MESQLKNVLSPIYFISRKPGQLCLRRTNALRQHCYDRMFFTNNFIKTKCTSAQKLIWHQNKDGLFDDRGRLLSEVGLSYQMDCFREKVKELWSFLGFKQQTSNIYIYIFFQYVVKGVTNLIHCAACILLCSISYISYEDFLLNLYLTNEYKLQW